MEKRYLNIDEAAEYTGWSKHTLYQWVSQKRVPVVKKGRRLRFDRHDLDEWMSSDTVLPEQDSTRESPKRKTPDPNAKRREGES